MSLLVLPTPSTPNLTVKALAKLMVSPASALTSEVQAHKYPRGGGAAHRVPYYQAATTTLTRFLKQGGDVVMLGEAVAELEASLARATDNPATPSQTVSRLQHNLRVLGDVPSFPQVRKALNARRGRSATFEVQGFKVRSTPDLTVQFEKCERQVFLHLKAEPIDEDEARRVLELALWVAQKGGAAARTMGDFEYWDLGADCVHRWPRTRKRTAKKALETLPVLRGVWLACPKPEHYQAPAQTGDATGV